LAARFIHQTAIGIIAALGLMPPRLSAAEDPFLASLTHAECRIMPDGNCSCGMPDLAHPTAYLDIAILIGVLQASGAVDWQQSMAALAELRRACRLEGFVSSLR
jgi:hypothetical protein